MSYRVEPLVRRIWDDRAEEVVELDVYGYRVISSDGKTVLAEAETRESALRAASAFILMPQ